MKKLFTFAAKSFFGGCIGAFGAALSILFIAIVIWLLPGPSPIDEYIEQRSPTGTSAPTPKPTPAGELPAISIWMTLSAEPSGERIIRIPKDQLTELNVWAASDTNDSVPFRIWLIGPMGNDPWGPEFETSPNQTPISVGKFGSAMSPGTYHLEVRIGDTKVGELEFEVIE